MSVNRKILDQSARLRLLARARVSGAASLRDIATSIEGTGANLETDFGDYERQIQGLLGGYLSDVEKYLKRKTEI